VNFQTASPEYPGREPLHFAHDEQVERYDATAHLMTSKVNDGPILAVEYRGVPAGSWPTDPLAMGNAAAYRLAENVVAKPLRGQSLKPLNMAWSGKECGTLPKRQVVGI
jgi:hypothetical protein